MTDCLCTSSDACPQSYPPSYVVIIEGVQNTGGSFDCASYYNKTFTLSPGVGNYCHFAQGLDFPTVWFSVDEFGNFYVQLFLPDGAFGWTDNVRACAYSGALELWEVYPNSQCDFSSATVTIRPGAPVSMDTDQIECLNLKNCVPNPGESLAAPFLGAPTFCCYPSDGKTDECGCKAAPGPVTIVPQIINCSIVDVPTCQGNGFFPPPPGQGSACGTRSCATTRGTPAGNPMYSRHALFDAMELISEIRSRLSANIPGLSFGPAAVNISNGNLFLTLGAPGGGNADPIGQVTYNSTNAAVSGNFGYAWSGSFNRKVVTADWGLAVEDGHGNVIPYYNPDGSDEYIAPLDQQSTLEQTGSTYSEYFQNGWQYNYDTYGRLSEMVNSAGDIWTTSYDGSGLLTTLANTAGGITTLAYDGSNQLQSITDSYGRTTNFTIDGSGDLVSITTPEMCVTSLVYDSHLLVGHVDPAGNCYSYTYDGNGWIQSIQSPLDDRVTFSWDTWTETQVTDPTGAITTVLYDFPRNVAGVITPAGTCSTYTYNSTLLTSYTDANGNVTTFTYADLDNRTTSLESVTFPDGGCFTYAYDADSRVQAIVDQFGNCSTLVWDGSSMQRRIALVDAANNCWTYSYNAHDQVQAETDPLGQTTTLSYDASANLLARVDPLGNATTYTYDNGQPIAIQDANGHVTSYVRDDTNRILSTTDPRGYTTTYTFGLNCQRSAMADPLGNVTTYLYDPRGLLQAQVDPLGAATTFAYDSRENRIAVTNPLGFVATYQYDAINRLSATVNPLGQTTTVGYDPASNPITLENPLGNVTTTGYDALNRPQAVTNALGYTTTVAYDLAGNTRSMTNANGQITTYGYDALNQQTSRMNPLGAVTTTVYDTAMRPSAVQNALGYITTTLYDAASRPYTKVDALGNVTTLLYDAGGRQTGALDPLGNRSTFVYDNANHLTATINPLGNATTAVYDPAGRPTATVDALGNRSTIVYDPASRPVAAVNPLGFVTTSVYDLAGRRTAITDANGNTTTSAYDAANRLIATVNALGYATTTVYDPAGRTVALENANGGLNTFTLDAASRKIQDVDPLGRVTTYGYDRADRLTSKLDARGVLATYSYDRANQMILRQYTNDATVTLAYDPVGNRSGMQDGVGSWTYTYDPLNRSQSVTNPANKTVSYSYDPRGFRQTMTEPGGGLFTYSYDSAGRLSSLNNPDGHRATYTYDAADRRVRKQLANGTSASMSYDAASRLTVVANMISMTPNQFQYTYDNVGNRVGLAFFSVDTTTDWTYDATYQLINEALVGPGPFNTTYVYDPVGNRLVKNDSGALTTSTYDAANQLKTSVAAAGTTTYAFDAAGNQLTESAPTGITTSTWDDENRRTKVVLPSAVINTAVYNGDSLRVEKQDSTGTTLLIWDGQAYLEETDASNVTNAIYTVEPTELGQVISQTRKSGATWTPSYYHYDGLGSTSRLSSATKSILGTYAYKAFGEMTTGSGATPVNPFRFIGQLGYYFDADLLDNYVRARWYRPVIARWLSADPVGFMAFDINLFRYVMNNAANAVDPSGTTILSHCTIGKYLSQYATGKWRRTPAGERLYTTVTASTGRSPLRTEIVSRMIKSTYEFHVKGTNEGECLENIEKNVESRVSILRLAEAKKYGFTGGPLVQHFTVPGVDYTTDPFAYFNSINNPRTLIGCTWATMLTFNAGIGTWGANSGSRRLSGIDDVIPGDWGYIYNDANTSNATGDQDPNWRPGLEGENVIYVGANRFWGNFGPGVIAQTWQQWFADIRTWPGKDGTTGEPRMSRNVQFSTLGLE